MGYPPFISGRMARGGSLAAATGGVAGFSNGWSCSLDGTDDAVLLGDTDTTLFNFGTGDFSLSIWFKPDAAANYNELWTAHDAGGWIMYLGDSDVFGFYGDDTGLKSGGSVNLDSWNHGAVVRTSTKLKLYLNGEKILGDTISSTAVFNKNSSVGRNVTVGMGQTGNNSAYDGRVDEAALWLSALSDGGVSTGVTAGGDISTIYNSGLPGDIETMSPIGWWRMGDSDSGTGTTVTDVGGGVGGSYVNGALANGAAFSTDIPS
jgi:hypothetical protein